MRRFIRRLTGGAAAAVLGATAALFGGHAGAAAERVALLIGNSDYEHVSPLKNPGNDVTLLNEKLVRLGFDVEVATNLDLTEMNRALRRFNERARAADTAFFFYAGHGMEMGGGNYLIPTDAELAHAGDEEVEAMALSKAIAAASHARRLSIVVIDACRDNRFASFGNTRSLTRGFKAVEARPRQIVAFSTAPGALAFDGEGEYSPFTQALSEALDKADQLDVRILFGGLGPRLQELVEEPQVPFMHSSGFGTDLVTLTGVELVAFNPSGGATAAAQRPGPAPVFEQIAPPQSLTDRELLGQDPTPPEPLDDGVATIPVPMKRPRDLGVAIARIDEPAADEGFSDEEWRAFDEAFRADIERAVLQGVNESFDYFDAPRRRPARDEDRVGAAAPASPSDDVALDASEARLSELLETTSVFGGGEAFGAELAAVELGSDAPSAQEAADAELESVYAAAETLGVGVRFDAPGPIDAARETEAELAAVIDGAPAERPGPGDLSVFQECRNCPSMVALPGGPFLMGSPANEAGRGSTEGPQTAVNLSRFAIGVYEVTFDEWDACVADGYCERGERIADDRNQGRGSMPVVYVSDYDINGPEGFIAWLNSKVDGTPYRLPSEAEWEYAARAGTETPFATGPKISTIDANYSGLAQSREYASYRGGVAHGQATVVGAFPANAFGIHDMHGNVWERVADCWSADLSDTPANGGPRGGGGCERGVRRGGSYGDAPRDVRSAARFGLQSSSRAISVGFRVARDL